MKVSRHIKLPPHQHNFVGGNQCVCGAVMMNFGEFELWNGIWDKYYEEVKNTESYAIWKDMLLAIKHNQPERVYELKIRAKEIISKDEWQADKPILPDPRDLQKTGRCVII